MDWLIIGVLVALIIYLVYSGPPPEVTKGDDQ